MAGLPRELDALNTAFLEAITRRQRHPALIYPPGRSALAAIRAAFVSNPPRPRVTGTRRHSRRGLGGARIKRDALHDSGHFERQARSTPDRVALICKERRVTFGALENSASTLAAVLQERGLTESARVGIYMSRSVEAVVAILAVLKAGGVYVPIDPNDPSDRQRFIIEDSGIDLMVCSDRWAEASALFDPARVVEVNERREAPAFWPPRNERRPLNVWTVRFTCSTRPEVRAGQGGNRPGGRNAQSFRMDVARLPVHAR